MSLSIQSRLDNPFKYKAVFSPHCYLGYLASPPYPSVCNWSPSICWYFKPKQNSEVLGIEVYIMKELATLNYVPLIPIVSSNLMGGNTQKMF